MGKVIIADWIARISNGTDIYERFNDAMTLDTLAHRSKVSNIQHLHTMRMLCPDLDFDKLDEAGIKRILLAVIKKYNNPVTQTNKKLSLRKWLISSKQDHLIKLVKVGNAHSKSKLPEDMITKQELEAMLKSCSHPRDSAIIALLYDSGSRIGELLSMRVRDVEFDDQGAIVTYPEGKTGWRKNRVVFAASYLRVWLDVHEYRDDKDAPLFYSLRGHYKDKNVAFLKRGEPGNKIMTRLTDEAVRRQLKIIASKAGVTRNIHPHLFRHTRATELANHLTEQQLKKQFGWTASSNMAAKYVHLGDKDTERAILKASGVQVEEDENITREALKCSRCKEINAPMAEFCFKCGFPLSSGAIAKMEAERARESEAVIEMRQELEAMKAMQADRNLTVLATDMVFTAREADIHALGKKYAKECELAASYFPVKFTIGKGFHDASGKEYMRMYALVPAIKEQITKWTQEIFENMRAAGGKDFADEIKDRIGEAQAATRS